MAATPAATTPAPAQQATTPGREALAEAARLEAAAVYSRTISDTTLASRQTRAEHDAALLAAALDRLNNAPSITRAIHTGAGVDQLMRVYRLTRDEARRAILRAVA